jgi:hypothetical protein
MQVPIPPNGGRVSSTGFRMIGDALRAFLHQNGGSCRIMYTRTPHEPEKESPDAVSRDLHIVTAFLTDQGRQIHSPYGPDGTAPLRYGIPVKLRPI